MLNNCSDLSKNYKNRYILKGQPGTGQTTILSNIAKTAQAKGHYVEIYHNTLSPQQIQMLLLPNLEIAIIADEQLSEHNWQERDHIINLSSTTEIAPTEQTALTTAIASAGEKISQAKKQHDELEKYYRKAMDFEEVDETGKTLFNKVLAIAAHKEKSK